MKMGRPKNPRIKALENKILKLEDRVKELLESKSDGMDLSTLKCVAVGGARDKKTGRYLLQVIKYDPITKLGKITESIDAGDAFHRASFELNKFIARHFTFEEIE